MTVPVQCLVEDRSRVTLFEGTKSDLAGFYDPSPSGGPADGDDDDEGGDDGEADAGASDKALLVLYLYQGVRHRVLAGDLEGLRMPKNNHRIRKA